MKRALAPFVTSILLALAAPASAAPATEPVDPGTGAGESGRPVISGDGRWVAFSSEARLTADDTSDAVDVYVRDLAEDETILVTPAPDDRNRLNYDPAISDDGRFVAFTSQGPGLLPADTNSQEDVYLKDLDTGELTIVSARRSRARGGRYAALSGNGRWVAFVGDELVRGDRNGDRDVYVRNVVSGKMAIVSRLDNARQTSGGFDDVDVSSDGLRVAYVLGGGLYVYDRGNGRRVRADVNNRGKAAEHPFVFGNVSLSGDGRSVAFASTAGNLSRRDDNGRPDVYVRNLRAETTELVSVGSDGNPPAGEQDSWSVWISQTGRFVAFGSEANLAGEDTDEAAFDVYVRDRREDTTLLATPDCPGDAGHPSLSNDGQWVAFVSEECGEPGSLYARGPLLEP
jgi:Tol biopolymer transport system component